MEKIKQEQMIIRST